MAIKNNGDAWEAISDTNNVLDWIPQEMLNDCEFIFKALLQPKIKTGSCLLLLYNLAKQHSLSFIKRVLQIMRVELLESKELQKSIRCGKYILSLPLSDILIDKLLSMLI